MELIEVEHDDHGAIARLRCRYLPPETKVKGTIHWVSAEHAVDADVRIYDRLFDVEQPQDLDDLNPNSLQRVSGCKLEPSVAGAAPGSRFQLERVGYFCVDLDSTSEQLILNRTITLRDGYRQGRTETAVSMNSRPSVPEQTAPPRVSQPSTRSIDPADQAAATALQARHPGLRDEHALELIGEAQLVRLLDEGVSVGASAEALVPWLLTHVRRTLKERSDILFDGAALAELVALVDGGDLSPTGAKEVYSTLASQGGAPAAIMAAQGLAAMAEDALGPLIDEVLAAHPGEVTRYREGEKKLLGFLLGQAMRASKGRADAKELRTRLQQQLG